MRRTHLFEFMDLSWYPETFRRIQTDYLQSVATRGGSGQQHLIPIVPLVTCWDGVVSLLLVYSPDELKTLTATISSEDYVWEMGVATPGTPVFTYTYLVGYPA